jgi:hypothetical protein
MSPANLANSTHARTWAIPSPSDRYAYIDKIQLWLKRPLPAKDIEWLQGQCGSMRVYNERARFDWFYRQRLQLNQPTRDALQSLSTLKDTLLNSLEVSPDLIFNSEEERVDAYDFVSRYLVKKHHRKQEVGFYTDKNGSTRYSSRRRKVPNNLAIYGDRACRLTGEVYCLHFDWRMKGASALHRQGTASAMFCNSIIGNFGRRGCCYLMSI